MTQSDEAHTRIWDGVWDDMPLYSWSPVPMWTQVARNMRRRISEHNLPVGAPLPSESWLTAEYGLSRDTVRRAYRALREIGQIETRKGRGHYVAVETPMQFVLVLPGSKITSPPLTPEDVTPYWVIVTMKVEPPDGMEPLYFDSTLTTLIVA